MRRPAWLVAALLALPALLQAQAPASNPEELLRSRLEGRMVTVLVDMPATEQGIDVHPSEPQPLDHPRYAERLKKYGTAIRAGDRVMITKIRVKGKHVEFQLAGGGYGTAGDPSATVSAPTMPKSRRERDLERLIDREQNRVERRKLQDELDDLREEREREDARMRASHREAEERRLERIRSVALESGSRFNVRYRDRVPDATLTPDGLLQALDRWVRPEGATAEADSPAEDPSRPPVRRGFASLRKGLLESEAETVLGAPRSTKQRAEGRLTVVTRSYELDDQRVEAEFVEGVLVRYSIVSR